MFKFVLFNCKYGVSTKQQRHDHLWSANSVNRLQRSPSNHRRLKMTSDVVGKMQKIQRSMSTCAPRVFQRPYSEGEAPPQPWQEGSCSSLKSEEVQRKSDLKSVSSRGETEFIIQQDWRTKGVRTAGSMCHCLVGVQMGQRGRSGLDVRSITLDFGSANRTGSVSLQRTKRGKENQPNVTFAGQVLRFRLKKDLHSP